MNPFEILEVSPDASPDDIRAAYHRLAKQWHPDRFQGPEKAEAEERFRLLAEAFSQLKDPLRRPSLVPAAPRSVVPPAGRETASQPPPAPERSAEDWIRQARQEFNGGRVDHAKGFVQYALRMDGTKADAHILMADILEAQQDPRGAVKSLEAAHKLRPKDPDLLIRLGDQFMLLGLQARGARLLEEARGLAPDHKRFKAPAEGKVQGRKLATSSEEGGGLLEQIKGVFNSWLRKG